MAPVKVAEADFPTRFGHFRLYAFRMTLSDGTEEEAIDVRMGDLAGPPPLVRIHSRSGRPPRRNPRGADAAVEGPELPLDRLPA